MTRRQKSTTQAASRRAAASPAHTFAPVSAPRNLTGEVVARLQTEISAGRLVPGERLPTELAMMAAMKVSRTVVREAVSALRARGLVVTRQGSGAFVSDAAPPPSFKLEPELMRSLDAVADVLELRLAAETEAAALAAKRATAASLRSIRAAHATFEAAVARGEAAAEEDFALHLAIAAATGNPRFEEFLRVLGVCVIPRRDVRVWRMTDARHADYLARIGQEHARIVEAIAGRDPAAAREAMRAHLTLAATRYRRMASAG